MKVIALIDFTLRDFGKIKNIVRIKQDVKGKLFAGDIFECDKEMGNYLMGNNALKKAVVKEIIEDEIVIQPITEVEKKPVEKEEKVEEVEVVDPKKSKKEKKRRGR